MAKQQRAIPTLGERLAEQVREYRLDGGWDQETLAKALTAIGLRTTAGTITRIESGAQPVTVEQLFALATVLPPNGLLDLLKPPWRLGEHVFAKTAHVLGVVAPAEGAVIPAGSPRRAMLKALAATTRKRREAMIAESIGRSPDEVRAAAQSCYHRPADDEVDARFAERLEQVTPRPVPGTAAWRAHMNHAVRSVTRDVAAYLEGEQS